MTSFRFGPFSFGIPRPDAIKLVAGERVIVSYWSWKRFGYVRKLISICDDGDVDVKIL